MKKIILSTLVSLTSIFLLVVLSLFCYNIFFYQPEQMYNGIYNNNLTSVKSLINSGMDINKYKYDITESTNVLDDIYFEGTPEMAKLLIANGAKVDEKLITGDNALFMATYMNDIQLCQMIINRGVDINKADEDGYTVFDYAIMYGDDNILEYYLNNWFTPNSHNITSSLFRENDETGELTCIDGFERTKQLIKICNDKDIDTNLEPIIEKAYLGKSKEVSKLCTEKNLDRLTNSDKHLLSYVCAAFCDVDTLKKLKTEDVDITYFNNYYIDTLRCAAAYNSDKVIDYLIKECKDISKRHKAKDIDLETEVIDYTPLDYVIANDNKKMMNKLIDKGCKPGSITYEMYSEIHNKDILDYLAKKIKKQDGEDIETRLNDCVDANNTEALKVLIDNIKPSILKELTACSYSEQLPTKEIINLLTDNNITIDYESMLITAIKNHDMKMTKSIVSNLDSLDFGYDEDTIPVAVAIKVGDKEIFDYLVNNGAPLDIKYSINKSIHALARETNYSKDFKRHIYKTCFNKLGIRGLF